MTAQANATALLATLTTALAPQKVYELHQVPTTRPPNYVEFALSRRFGGEFKQSGDVGTTGYRITLRAVAQSSVTAAREDLEKCRAALENTSLTVGADATTPIQFETEDPVAADNGWFSGLMSFTYVI